MRYMREMWRILRINGLLVVVTTMDEALFESLALVPMMMMKASNACSGIDAVREASDWQQGSRMERVTTDEGGTVYYYSLRKLKDIVEPSIAPISKVSNSSSKEALFKGLQLLLDEARKAKEEMVMMEGAGGDASSQVGRVNDIDSNVSI